MPGTLAITLGLYDIHYDSTKVNLNGGTSFDLEVILEELAHAQQFLQVWLGLPREPGSKNEQGIGYDAAKGAWWQAYIAGAIAAGGYDNELERGAKQTAADILGVLRKSHATICGFDLTK